MKVKTLLLAAAAFMAMGAQAQSVQAPDLTIAQEDMGKVFLVPLTLTMPDGGDFTNIQVNFTLPEGLDVAHVNLDDAEENYILVEDRSVGADAWYTEVGEGIVQKGRPKEAVVSYTTNFDEPSNWPNYDIVGANMSKTPNTDNPNHFVTFFVTPKEGFAGGVRPIRAYVKYTQEDDQSFTFGTPEEREVICNVTFQVPDAVADINAAKAVSSVKYYNAAGVAADSAFEGVNIVVTKYADGSQSVVKVVK